MKDRKEELKAIASELVAQVESYHLNYSELLSLLALIKSMLLRKLHL